MSYIKPQEHIACGTEQWWSAVEQLASTGDLNAASALAWLHADLDVRLRWRTLAAAGISHDALLALNRTVCPCSACAHS